MKRTKTITADDGETKIVVSVKINSRRGLTRGESEHQIEDLADKIMVIIPDVDFFHGKLSRIQVS